MASAFKLCFCWGGSGGGQAALKGKRGASVRGAPPGKIQRGGETRPQNWSLQRSRLPPPSNKLLGSPSRSWQPSFPLNMF